MKKHIRKDKRKRQEAKEQWTERIERKALKRDKRVSEEKKGSEKTKRGQKGSRTLVRNRCVKTGYARSRIRWYRLSGHTIRNRARIGERPGVYKRSW